MDVQLDRARRAVLGAHTKREFTSRAKERSAGHLRTSISAAGSESPFLKPLLVTWAESFVFAGSSALLLLVANLFPQYWYVSFFALTPFLYRIIKASPGESLRLGFLLGLSFFGVLIVDCPVGDPFPSFLKLLCGNGLFALFGWSVGWARHRWGFNPAIVALAWVGLEVGLASLGFVRGLVGETGVSYPFFGGLVALFGFLSVSAIIVLLNSLLVLLILKTLSLKIPRGKIVQEDERRTDLFSAPWFVTQRAYLVPEGRAPPYIITGVSSFGLTNRLGNSKLWLDPGTHEGLVEEVGLGVQKSAFASFFEI